MRYFLLSLILASSQAFAYPSVGDKVTWSGTLKNPLGESSEVLITKEVIDFNQDTKHWKIKIQTHIGKESSEEIVDVADLFTHERYENILKNCESQGGVIEEVITNPGKYKTCKTRTITEDGILVEKWMGDIPFGVVSKSTQEQAGVASSKSPVRNILRDL
ncbi:MAG: hypothetical protein ACM3MG_00695 [Bacillota bacterium]